MTVKVPKYQEVAEWLKESIAAGVFMPGGKLISEPGLCKKFGISRHTARAAIAILEQDGIVSRKQGSGTYVNHFTSGARRKKIGILLTYADDYIFPTIISGIEEVLSEQGHGMSLSLTHNKVQNERNQLLSFLSDDIDGLIVEAVKSALPSPNLDIYDEFAARMIPCVFINTYHSSLDCNYIINNDVTGGRLAARHLIENGHDRIGGIFKHDDIQGSFRYKGFVKELYDHKLTLCDNSIVWYCTETLDKLFCSDQVGFILERLNGVSGVVCYNDQVSVRLIQACIKAGMNVPQDLSVVSFDNSNLSSITSVPLSSITHPGAEMGRHAARLILKNSNSLQSVHHIFEPQLVVRCSTRNISSPL